MAKFKEFEFIVRVTPKSGKDKVEFSAEPKEKIVRCENCIGHGACKHEQYLGLKGYCSNGEEK